jgi:hypothetical protein
LVGGDLRPARVYDDIHEALAQTRLTHPSTNEIVTVNRLRRKKVNPAAPGIREPAAPE